MHRTATKCINQVVLNTTGETILLAMVSRTIRFVSASVKITFRFQFSKLEEPLFISNIVWSLIPIIVKSEPSFFHDIKEEFFLSFFLSFFLFFSVEASHESVYRLDN